MTAATTTKSVQHVTEQFVLDGGVQSVKKYAAVSLDLPSIAAGSVGAKDVTVTGVKAGDVVLGVFTSDGAELDTADVVILGGAVNKDNNVRVYAFNGHATDAKNAAAKNVDFLVLKRA